MTYPEERINELIAENKELTRTLRGHNGTPGLLTQFALLASQVENIATEVRSMNDYGCKYITHEKKGGDPTLPVGPKPADESSIEKNAVTFRWLIEKFSVPVIVSLVTGIINLIVIVKFIAPLLP